VIKQKFKRFLTPALILMVWIIILDLWTYQFSAFTSYSYTFESQGSLPRSLPNFLLIDHSGKPIQLKDFKNKYLLLNFMYLHCTTFCGYSFSELQDVYQELHQLIPDTIAFMSISFDPKQDDPTQLKNAWERLGAKQGWTLATFDQSGLADMSNILDQIGVWVYQKSDGDFNHTTQLLLIDQHGKLIKALNSGEKVSKIAEEIRSTIQ